jgi:hypothetical protein
VVEIRVPQSPSALIRARHGLPDGTGISLGIWTMERHGLCGAPSVVRALGHHALLHQWLGRLQASCHPPNSIRLAKHIRRRSTVSTAVYARGSSVWCAARGVLPTRPRCMISSEASSGIATNLGEQSAEKSTDLQHLVLIDIKIREEKNTPKGTIAAT